LETHQEVTGLPAKFSFVDDQYEVSGESGRCRKCYRWTMRNRWYLAYNIVKFMVVVAIISVAYNTWHFLQQQIPV